MNICRLILQQATLVSGLRLSGAFRWRFHKAEQAATGRRANGQKRVPAHELTRSAMSTSCWIVRRVHTKYSSLVDSLRYAEAERANIETLSSTGAIPSCTVPNV